MPVSPFVATVRLVEAVTLPGNPTIEASVALAQPGTPGMACVQKVTLGAAKVMVT